ncbi:MAG: hypothetical protein GC151_02950 [Betaproteobacteria bacterium]|nr:hypothetical protein [Betaproteobacteria bacterium]
MKLQILSDLHLEYSDRHPPWTPAPTDADVVILAGDIDNGTRAIDWAERTFPERTVLYVPGNHEFYDDDIGEAGARLAARSAASPNVRLLDNTTWTADGVRVVGSTLWTDFLLFGEQSVEDAITESLKYVVDFRAIADGPGARFTPERSIELHRRCRQFLETELAKPFDGATIVVTHHGPHPKSVHPRWADNLTSAAFVSDLTPLMGTAKLWVHGHTHDSFDYVVNGTRVVANPMGYRKSNWATARETGEQPVVKFENRAFDAGLVVTVPA